MGKVLKMSDYRPPSENREIERRMRENADIIRRMKAGESLSRIPPQATFLPPPPIIKKDSDALKQLFPKKDDNK